MIRALSIVPTIDTVGRWGLLALGTVWLAALAPALAEIRRRAPGAWPPLRAARGRTARGRLRRRVALLALALPLARGIVQAAPWPLIALTVLLWSLGLVLALLDWWTLGLDDDLVALFALLTAGTQLAALPLATLLARLVWVIAVVALLTLAARLYRRWRGYAGWGAADTFLAAPLALSCGAATCWVLPLCCLLGVALAPLYTRLAPGARQAGASSDGSEGLLVPLAPVLILPPLLVALAGLVP